MTINLKLKAWKNTWTLINTCVWCRMPVQYVIEEWDFRDLTLKMKPPVFIPRPETEVREEKIKTGHSIHMYSIWLNPCHHSYNHVSSVRRCRSWLNSCSLIWRWSPGPEWLQTLSLHVWKWDVALVLFLSVCWRVCLRCGFCLSQGSRFLISYQFLLLSDSLSKFQTSLWGFVACDVHVFIFTF